MNTNTISVSAVGCQGKTAGLMILSEPILYPFSLTPLAVDDEKNLSVLQQAMRSDRSLAVFFSVPEQLSPEMMALYPGLPGFICGERACIGIGVLVRVVKELRLPDGTLRIVVRGLKRIRHLTTGFSPAGMPQVFYEELTNGEAEENDPENLARMKSLLLVFQELSGLLPGLPDELNQALRSTSQPGRVADILADSLMFSTAEKLALLALTKLHDRLELLAVLLNRELETTQLGMKIQNEVHEAMSESQREFYLREQLRTIKQELGEETRNSDVVTLEKRLAESDLPEAVEETVKRELERLDLIPQASPEYHLSYSYLCWLLDAPWRVFTEEHLDCAEAEKVLEADHYGLEEVKKRILEYLAVMQLRGQGGAEVKAPILCLVGPPGVGKTSIGQSIARAMNRKFIRVSLGGVRDEAEIRGHRRTYVGAMPGRIIQNLKRVGCANPVFMLDEIDKLAQDFRGDPASALLEVLDPAQNFSFNDNYLELGFDLSHVFFIATANTLETIPGPLRDRMEIIRIPGYTALEKREIAKRYLVPRQLLENAIPHGVMKFMPSGIDELIRYYTMEAGVRELERVISTICRRVARKLVDGGETESLKISPDTIHQLLGGRKYRADALRRQRRPGYALGMAWTAVGGAILPIEVLKIPGGKGELRLTGSLGKVMQESAATAFSLARTLSDWHGQSPEYFTTNDFHIHVPDGATPKDGPSAGITLLTALISLLRQQSIPPALAMTGELSLHGEVTAVGGIREKVVSALRAGVKTIIMPEENRKDYEELPEPVRDKLKFHFVSNYQDVLPLVFPKSAHKGKK